MDYEQEAVALYAVPPAQFTTARDVRIAELKGEKQAALAGRLKLLRRPTVAAWCVNLLAGAHGDELRALVGLGAQLADAQRRGDAGAIRSLSVEKRRRVETLVAAAARLAADSAPPRAESVGLDPAVVADVEATLNAAVADSAVARRVLSGRLVRGESYVGFGPLPEDHAPVSSTRSSSVRASSTGSASSSTGGASPAGEGRVAGEACVAAETPAVREARQRLVAEHAIADQAVAFARAERDSARRRRDVARHAREEAAAVLAEADRSLADAERTLAGYERTLARAERHRVETAARLDAGGSGSASGGGGPSGRRTSRSAARST